MANKLTQAEALEMLIDQHRRQLSRAESFEEMVRLTEKHQRQLDAHMRAYGIEPRNTGP